MEIVQLIKDNMLDYAGAVNQARAIPDARTGLKPIHRKILYEMFVDKIGSNTKYRKCAYMVGQIISRFSEHGDAATYDALVRLGQEWIQRYPLIDFHGNNGSQFGDGPAAMRYTEAKLTPLAEDGFLSTIKKDTVDWIPNFTNDEEEPVTLPAIFPGLFCLPNQGMGYGAACHFVTYNLSEVLNLVETYIKSKEVKIIYPDFASGGVLVNPNIVSTIQQTGKGSLIVDGKYSIKNQTIEFTEIPFNVNFDSILDEISELIEKEELSEIEEVKNNSGAGKLSLVIEVEKNTNPENVVNKLFGLTKLRNSYPVNQVALVDGQPKLLTTKDMLDQYIEHNLKCIEREHQYEYNKTVERIHILKGLIWSVQNIDDVIYSIRNNESLRIKNEDLTDRQIKAILDMKLGRLSKLEEEKLVQEKKEKEEYAETCKNIIDSKEVQKDILLSRLKDLNVKFGNARRTEIQEKEIVKITKASSGKIKTTIPENVAVVLTSHGYIKSVPLKAYKETVFDYTVIKAQTVDLILLFSSLGKVYRLKVGDIKQCNAKDKGTALGAILNLEKNERIINIFSMNTDERYPYIVGFTKNGLVKKSEKSIFVGATQNKNGLKAATLNEGDEYIEWYECNGDYAIVLSNDNYLIKFDMREVNAVGKTARGVKAINLNKDSYVLDAIVVSPQVDLFNILRYNNLHNQDVALQKRGGKGKCLAAR